MRAFRLVVQKPLWGRLAGVHWRGICLPNATDGVSGFRQLAIKPGEKFTYESTRATPPERSRARVVNICGKCADRRESPGVARRNLVAFEH